MQVTMKWLSINDANLSKLLYLKDTTIINKWLQKCYKPQIENVNNAEKPGNKAARRVIIEPRCTNRP